MFKGFDSDVSIQKVAGSSILLEADYKREEASRNRSQSEITPVLTSSTVLSSQCSPRHSASFSEVNCPSSSSLSTPPSIVRHCSESLPTSVARNIQSYSKLPRSPNSAPGRRRASSEVFPFLKGALMQPSPELLARTFAKDVEKRVALLEFVNHYVMDNTYVATGTVVYQLLKNLGKFYLWCEYGPASSSSSVTPSDSKPEPLPTSSPMATQEPSVRFTIGKNNELHEWETSPQSKELRLRTTSLTTDVPPSSIHHHPSTISQPSTQSQKDELTESVEGLRYILC